jgi:hypothetical protein
LSVAYHLVSMQLPEALLLLCLVFHPMIPPTQLPGYRSRVHELPLHLPKGLQSLRVVRLPALANWPPSLDRGVGLLIGLVSSICLCCIKL